MSTGSHFLIGLILKLKIWDQLEKDALFDDLPYWLVPLEGYPHVYLNKVPLPNRGESLFDAHGRRMSVGGVYEVSDYVDGMELGEKQRVTKEDW